MNGVGKYASRSEELKLRTKRFAIRIVQLVRCLPRTIEGRVIGNQIMRSGTSLASNYRGACRARSRPEFLAKLGVVVEEADETIFWLELIGETSMGDTKDTDALLREANELLAIFAASQHTARKNNSRYGKSSSQQRGSVKPGDLPLSDSSQ